MDSSNSRIAKLLHHRAQGLSKGEPVALPIVTATTFHHSGEPDGSAYYARVDTPTVEALEAELGILEDADVVSFPSGMAAITAAFMACVGAGDRLLIPSDGYYNTRRLGHGFLAGLGVDIRECATPDMADADFEGVTAVLVETPANPSLRLGDLSGIASRAKAVGARLIADNTTATPLGQQPLDLGFDLTLSADTKAIAGHSDVLAGHVAGHNAKLMARVREWRTLSGSVPSPFGAFLVHRGLSSFEVRWRRMCANAMAVAEALAAALGPDRVHYPGLPSHSQHDLARRQMSGFGSVLACEFEDADAAEGFIAACPQLVPATSFGGVHSSAERRARWGDAVGEGYVRISCGVEPTDVLVASMKAAVP